MNEPSELFSSERPVRSDFSRRSGFSYAARRLITLAVLLLIVLGGGSWLWGRVFPSAPGEIPTIKAEGAYKQRPDQPGGIDIPHQDVQVYHEIDGSAGGAKPVLEHMLPPPEVPNVPPPADAPAQQNTDVAPQSPVENLMPQPQTPIQTTVSPPAAAVVPAPAPVAAAPAVEPPAAASPVPPAGKDGFIIQLAASPDRHAAEDMAQKLQTKYRALLDTAHLHVQRADLGAKGVFYRIQSQPLAEAQAKSICASLKKTNAGCLLVHP
jgi:hypothetical protein